MLDGRLMVQWRRNSNNSMDKTPWQLPTAIFGAPIGGEAPDFRAPLARESNL